MNTTRILIRTTAVILIVSLMLSACGPTIYNLKFTERVSPKEGATIDFRGTEVYPIQIDDVKFYKEINTDEYYIRDLAKREIVLLKPGVHDFTLIHNPGKAPVYGGICYIKNKPVTMGCNLEVRHLYNFKPDSLSNIKLVDLGSNKNLVGSIRVAKAITGGAVAGGAAIGILAIVGPALLLALCLWAIGLD